MSAAVKKSVLVFGISVVVIALIMCLVPVELFNGEATWTINDTSITRDHNLSLSYFFGIGLEDSEIAYADSFRLTAQGWMLAFIFILGIPGLIAYRIYLTSNKEE